jgi:hypothetical protein
MEATCGHSDKTNTVVVAVQMLSSLLSTCCGAGAVARSPLRVVPYESWELLALLFSLYPPPTAASQAGETVAFHV